MCRGQISAGEKQVLKISRYATAQRNIVEPPEVILGARSLRRRIDAFWRMEVNRPTAERDRVGKRARVHQIALGQNVLTHEAPALTFTRYHSDPVERPVRHVETRLVFDVVPDPERDREQFVADVLVVFHRVEATAPLDPPVTIFEPEIGAAFAEGPQRKIRRLKFSHPWRRNIRHRPIVLLRLKQNRGAERLRVTLLRRECLAKRRLTLATAHNRHGNLGAESSVARAVGKHRRCDGEPILRRGPLRYDVTYPALLDASADHRGVEQ